MAANTSDKLAQRLYQRARLDSPDASGRKERGEGKVGLGRDERDVVGLRWEGLNESDGLELSGWSQ